MTQLAFPTFLELDFGICNGLLDFIYVRRLFYINDLENSLNFTYRNHASLSLKTRNLHCALNLLSLNLLEKLRKALI